MKVVLETNVLVSAAMTAHGACAQIVDLLAEGMFELCADDRILAEYETVLRRPELGIIPQDAEYVLELISATVENVAAVPLQVTLADPTDLPFLEVARTADAMPVTGNLRHFPKCVCGPIMAVSPAEFLNMVRQST